MIVGCHVRQLLSSRLFRLDLRAPEEPVAAEVNVASEDPIADSESTVFSGDAGSVGGVAKLDDQELVRRTTALQKPVYFFLQLL